MESGDVRDDKRIPESEENGMDTVADSNEYNQRDLRQRNLSVYNYR